MSTSTQTKTNRTVTGKVVSNKMDKTIVVAVVSKVKHPIYGKYVKRISKLFAHDVNNQCKAGDTVVIKQSRPLSRNKNWELVEILSHTSGE